MAISTRQSNLFAAEDWKQIYNTFRTADFQSYDYETLRKSMVDYLRTYYPENFNDYIESSEFIALLDLVSFMGQSLSFRSDLNARENFLSTAERRDSVYRLASMIGYSPKRHINASGTLKIVSVNTTELMRDSSGQNLANQTIFWDDPTNLDWQEQFTTVLNAALQPGQRVGRPSGSLIVGDLTYELYQLRLRQNLVPIFPFTSSINGTTYPFEIYNIGLDKTKGLFEVSPQASDSLGITFVNDGRGNGSINTGFFVGFKQGNLNNLDFTLTEQLPNRLVGLNLNDINNNDVWLFELSDAGGVLREWTNVPNLKDSNIIYNTQSNDRYLYSVSSRVDDQIDMIFGDGIFSNIPVGKFRAVVRTSAGEAIVITPNMMQGVNISIAYLSRQNRIENLTLRCALQYTVNNADVKEELSNIKANAPQYYYTQNRMINAQDYNVYPYTRYNEIAKIKSVNRTASGISRFLDIKDATGKYSSTNVFCDDGYLFKSSTQEGSKFVWNTLSDIRRFIRNDVRNIVNRKASLHLYYNSYPLYNLPDTIWVRGTAEANSSTGYFGNSSLVVQTVGDSASNNRKFLKPGSLIRFEAPMGKYFDIDGQLKIGTATYADQVTQKWATVVSVVDDGTNNGKGLYDTGLGPIVLNKNIPSDAIATSVYAPYNAEISASVEQAIVTYIISNQDFGISYDEVNQTWKIIDPNILDLENEFSFGSPGTSWIIAMINNGNNYTVYTRGLDYLFGSVLETRFYFDNRTKIYDPRSASVIKDTIKFLKFNENPAGDGTIGQDIDMEIHDSVVYTDGYADDTIIKVTYSDSDNDGVPDDPTVFDTLVGQATLIDQAVAKGWNTQQAIGDIPVAPTPSDINRLVFFEKYLDFDNLERYKWRANSTISLAYATKDDIELAGLYANPVGTVFFAYAEQAFYVLELIEDDRVVSPSDNFTVRIGRSNFRFQYKHNSPNDRRIDPSPSNIIDMYVLTSAYDKEYRRYLKDITGKVVEPLPSSTVSMSLAFQDLENFKATSDAIIFNPVKFKSLFGSKAESQYQATFKVVKSEGSRLTNTQVRNAIINTIDSYFALDNWDFGDTFYFSELAAYIHKELSKDIAAIVIVPKVDIFNFGDFMQIGSAPNELLISAATVDDVELIDSITATKLKATNGASISYGNLSQTRNVIGGY